MGTRVRLAAYAADRAAALVALDSALSVLEDTEQELSTWRPDSEISALNRVPVGTPWRANRRLCMMFADVFQWQRASSGAFDAAIGALADIWRIHEGGRVPSRSEVTSALARTGSELLAFDLAACTLTRRTEVTIDVGGFGKGEGLDRAAAALGGRDWMIDLGGQVSVSGSLPDGQPWAVELADPLDRQRPVARIRMHSGSLSTSAGSERDLLVDGRRVSHILDPRTGQPAPFEGSVTAWHERALVADMLSTALYVMGPEEGLSWATSHGLDAAYLLPDHGRVRIVGTPEFTRRVQPIPPTTVHATGSRPSSERE